MNFNKPKRLSANELRVNGVNVPLAIVCAFTACTEVTSQQCSAASSVLMRPVSRAKEGQAFHSKSFMTHLGAVRNTSGCLHDEYEMFKLQKYRFR